MGAGEGLPIGNRRHSRLPACATTRQAGRDPAVAGRSIQSCLIVLNRAYVYLKFEKPKSTKRPMKTQKLNQIKPI
jgi:hypothetical protein